MFRGAGAELELSLQGEPSASTACGEETGCTGWRERSPCHVVSAKASAHPVGSSERGWPFRTKCGGIGGSLDASCPEKGVYLVEATFWSETSFQRRLIAASCQWTTFPATGGENSPVLNGNSEST